MVIPGHGNRADIVQVNISFSIPMDTLLDPGSRIYSQEDRHPPEIQALVEQWRRPHLPAGHDALVRAVRDLLELTEAVQSDLLDSIVDGQVNWQVQRPGGGA